MRRSFAVVQVVGVNVYCSHCESVCWVQSLNYSSVGPGDSAKSQPDPASQWAGGRCVCVWMLPSCTFLTSLYMNAIQRHYFLAFRHHTTLRTVLWRLSSISLTKALAWPVLCFSSAPQCGNMSTLMMIYGLLYKHQHDLFQTLQTDVGVISSMLLAATFNLKAAELFVFNLQDVKSLDFLPFQ